MASKLQQYRANVLECQRRAEAADNPGVRKAYRRAAAQWSDITEQVGRSARPRRQNPNASDQSPRRRQAAT